VYDITRQMTPLESRLESLAAAEEAWKYRSDGRRRALEEEMRRTLARLTQRLQVPMISCVAADVLPQPSHPAVTARGAFALRSKMAGARRWYAAKREAVGSQCPRPHECVVCGTADAQRTSSEG
jgi:hypothetical protein